MPVREFDATRRLAAEALGTGLLLATVVGSGIMAARLTDDVALALLGNTIATGAMLFVLITILGPVSGGHLNPAVSLVAALQRALPWRDAACYIAAQVSGGIAGTMLAHAMFDLPLLQWGMAARSGGGQWLAEAMATFGLVLVILLGMRLRRDAVPALVGCYIIAAYWFTASTAFANPAVTLARALTDSFSGIRPVDAPGFMLAQIAGALLALALAGWLLRPMEEQA